ncbi:hypothetical protein HMPREF0179_05099 [Bilophila wadsworthia 3_1_6]|uniref:Uncharacterized protein n=1 Tax=Bilophila wadsworthia (strain 3_1_6) TaxID=563192 RepID=S2LKQ0_BILW3|nr:hypothetical protein HMPREF0179_05099 [Bilophila wadsworthia 3_1_6]
MCVHAEPFAAELLPRGLPVAVFAGRGFLGKSLFLGICYAFALCSAVQEEMVALATLFE